MVDILKHNEAAWDEQATSGAVKWSSPFSEEVIAKAKRGNWDIVLTPTKPVPKDWFGNIEGKQILGLASGGGQQMPVLAAAGAIITSLDQSKEQLKHDEYVAVRDGLKIKTLQGDMADLNAFGDASFDLIFHPVSNTFCKDILPVWQEASRVLKSGGRLLSGFMNPDFFLFDHLAIEKGAPLEVSFKLPFEDALHMPKETLDKLIADKAPLEHSHSMDTQIGGQIAAGLQIHGFYEDWWSTEATPLNDYMPTSFATLAVKP